MEKSRINYDSKFDELWDKYKDRIEEDESGKYISVDDLTLEKHGIHREQIDTLPNNASASLSGNDNQPRYFLRGFGRGKSKLFRSFS